ncbi:hypothetical protein DFH08DRAFT_931187 [Mycena albidolilacea]|uniref:Uncharacterized protein n=1 Tax=Mycena albidolilacea TaxID=1033008 RepID=A0AAD7AJR4_9AGAR|nr:hypothetical protein DFH08DRAFT_931187 [Mycena albidolilacea]
MAPNFFLPTSPLCGNWFPDPVIGHALSPLPLSMRTSTLLESRLYVLVLNYVYAAGTTTSGQSTAFDCSAKHDHYSASAPAIRAAGSTTSEPSTGAVGAFNATDTVNFLTGSEPTAGTDANRESQKVATDAAHKPSDPATSYGMSPFAHNPVAKMQPNPTPNIGAPPAQQPVASSATPPAPSHTAIIPMNTQLSSDSVTEFGTLPQRASPPQSYLDIPHANIQVKKYPSGEIRFFCPNLQTYEQVWISPEAAFQQLRFQGAARIFVNPKGLNELLQVLLPKVLENSPPVPMPKPKPVETGYTPAVRTPKEADKRFMAHDILRALGKTPLDDDCVRVAKQRAMEAPQPCTPLEREHQTVIEISHVLMCFRTRQELIYNVLVNRNQTILATIGS